MDSSQRSMTQKGVKGEDLIFLPLLTEKSHEFDDPIVCHKKIRTNAKTKRFALQTIQTLALRNLNIVKELNYTTISDVIDSWEELKRTKNYEEVAGSILFQHLFENAPESKVLFGFPLTIDPTSKELLQSRRFKMHAVYMIQMLDTALNMLVSAVP